MTSLDRLELLLVRALQKVKDEKLRDITRALALLLPETLAAVQGVSIDPLASPHTRLQAANLLLSLHSRVLAADLEADRTQALRAKARAVTEAARAERSRVRLEGKKTDLAIAAKRRRMQRVLDKAIKEQEKTT